MENFRELASFFFSLFELLTVYIDGYRFSLKGACVFAAIVLIAIAFIRWLFAMDE